jgi:hypothetical protein
MISIEQLRQTLSNTNFKEIVLPNGNNYCQVGYQALRADKTRYEEEVKQQQAIKTAVEAGIEVNVIKSDNIDGFNELVKKEDKGNYRIANVKYSSYLNYSENSTFDLPEDLIELIGEQMNDTVKLYGLKNPNSFIKSVILLNDPNYMVFNKYQMNQAVFKWRTDLAYHFKNNQKQFSKLPRTDIANLETMTLRENYHNSAIAQLAASYTGKNMIVLDYINKQYEIYLADMEEHYLDDISKLVSQCYKAKLDFYLIIKYQDCYMPCLKVDNNNYFKIFNDYKELELTNIKYYFNKVVDTSNIIVDNIVDDNIVANNLSNVVNNDDNTNDENSEINKETKMLSSVVDVSKLKRDAMQRIAIAYDIDIMKSGSKAGRQIKKTKQDLYNDFKMVVYDEKKMSVAEF